MKKVYTDLKKGDVIKLQPLGLELRVGLLQGRGDMVLSFPDGGLRNRTLLRNNIVIINEYLQIQNSGNRGYGNRAHVTLCFPENYFFEWIEKKRVNGN